MKTVIKCILLALTTIYFYDCTSSACDDVYAPVCGSNGKTYSNSCYARAKGIKSYTSGECPIETEAVIVLSANGCDYLIETTEDTFKPTNLEPAFQLNGMNIRLKYRRQPDEFYCSNNQNSYYQIEILEIEEI